MTRMVSEKTLATLTQRQILIEILHQVSTIRVRLTALESKMTDLSTAVSDLTVAVDGVVAQLLPKITALESANGALQTALDGMTALDATDKSLLQASLDDAAAATAAIRADTATLNALATTPPPPPAV